MKQATLLFLVVVFAASCTNVIDKKVNLKTAKEDFAKIKQEYKDKYTADEFAALSDDMGRQFIKGSSKTYRELLDTIHAEKLRYDEVLKTYNAEIKKLQDAITITVTKSYAGKGNYGIGDYYNMLLDVKNTSGKDIAAYKGVIEVKSLTDTKLDGFMQESSKAITAGQTVQDGGAWAIYKNVFQFREASTDKLKFNWMPLTIVFADGTQIEAPTKPRNPLKLFEQD